MTYEVTVEGVCDLLMHKFSTEELTNPVDAAENSAYRLEDGRLYLPSEHFFQSMIRAASEFRIDDKSNKTYRDYVQSAVLIEPESIPFGIDVKYSIDSRPVKSKVVRHRPRISRGWTLTFDINILVEQLISKDILNAILTKAGQKHGVGDYRPRFGRFMVVEFQEK